MGQGSNVENTSVLLSSLHDIQFQTESGQRNTPQGSLFVQSIWVYLNFSPTFIDTNNHLNEPLCS